VPDSPRSFREEFDSGRLYPLRGEWGEVPQRLGWQVQWLSAGRQHPYLGARIEQRGHQGGHGIGVPLAPVQDQQGPGFS
jgi:hypothetical protein